MPLTKRKKRILNLITREYIKRAEPISSEFLRENYNLGISAPTIRIEMRELAEAGYLWQPHTSGGRIPTDKGYRFLVDDLLERDFSHLIDEKFFKKLEGKKPQDVFEFLHWLTRILAATSSNFALTYLYEKDLFWKDGLGGVFQEPEFKDSKFCCNFIDMIEDFEKEIRNFREEEFLTTEIFIGQENLLPGAQNFSIMISQCHFSKNQHGFISILGPKRMAYDKNIKLINSALKLLKSYSQ